MDIVNTLESVSTFTCTWVSRPCLILIISGLWRLNWAWEIWLLISLLVKLTVFRFSDHVTWSGDISTRSHLFDNGPVITTDRHFFSLQNELSLLTVSLSCVNDKILNPRTGVISGERRSRYQLNVIHVLVCLEDAFQGNRDVIFATLIGLPFPLPSHLIRSKSCRM